MGSILETVKTLLNIQDTEQDELLSLYIDIVRRRIENYCNISVLPPELRLEAAQMAADMYRENESQDGQTGGVSSVSEAGRTVSFNASLVQTRTENKINERKQQLNRFRRVYKS